MAGFASCVERCKAYFLDNPNISKPSSCLCSWSFAACTAQGKVSSAVLLMLQCVCLYVAGQFEMSVGALRAQQGCTLCCGIYIEAMDSRGICLGSWRMHLLCPACRTVRVHCAMTVASLPSPFSGTLIHMYGQTDMGMSALLSRHSQAKTMTCS